MPVTLRNREQRKQTFNLTSNCVDRHTGLTPTNIRVTAWTRSKSGNASARIRDKGLPPTLTLLSGETRKDLPYAVIEAPEVRAAIDARRLQIVAVSADKKPVLTKAPSSKPKSSKTK